MNLELTYKSGSEEWLCPICGRRMVIQWEPSFSWMILEVGDESVFHNGAKGGINIQNMTLTDQEDVESLEIDLSELDDPSLGPWKDWLNKIDFGNL